MINNLKKLVLTVAALAALALGGAAIAGAQSAGESGDGEGGGFTSTTAQKAKAAALKATGGGKANAFERDGENGATYEVEVTKPGGSTVDVRLDDGFGVVIIEGDSDSGE